MKKPTMFSLIFAGILLGIICSFISTKLLIILILISALGLIILFDYQKALYLIAFYVFIDFILRNFNYSTFLQSSWDELFFVFCFLIWLVKWLIYRRTPLYVFTVLEFPIIFLALIMLFELFFTTPDIKIGIEGFRVMFEYLLVYIIVTQLVHSPKTIKYIIYFLVLIGSLIGTHGIYQYIIKVEIPPNWVDKSENVRTRVFSIIGSPNILGSLMILLIPIAIALIFAEVKRGKKILAIICTCLMFLCLVFTMSRAAWFGFIGTLIVYILIKDKRLIIFLLISIILAVLFIPPVTQRLNYLTTDKYLENSSKDGRIYRYKTGLELLAKNPITGVGIGHFGGAVAANHKIPGNFYMDNFMLKTAVETGLLGILFYLILIYNSLIWGFRALKTIKTQDIYYYKLVQGILAGMCGVIFHNFFENVFEVPMIVVYYWLLAGSVIYLGYLHNGSLKTLDNKL